MKSTESATGTWFLIIAGVIGAIWAALNLMGWIQMGRQPQTTLLIFSVACVVIGIIRHFRRGVNSSNR